MADSVKDTIDVSATTDEIFEVATDFANYPEWNSNIKNVEVKETDDDGRATKVWYEVDAKVKTVRYTLGYDYSNAPESFSWDLIDGDVKALSGSYSFDEVSEPTEVTTNLWAEQIDPQQRLDENWREIQSHAVAVLQWAGIEEIEAEELSVIPGLDELFSLADVKRHHDEGPYDCVVVDCAPTGETLRLLSLPDILQWYMEKIFPVERRVMGALRPVARRMTSLPLPDDSVYSAVRRFYDRLEGVRQVLTDGTTTSVRLVVNPERMVIAEAKRTYTYLNLFGYRIDAVIANRLIPDRVSDPYFDRWKELQREHLHTIDEAFSPLPILTARLHDQELVGAELLGPLGAEVYGDRDPAGILFDADPMTIAKQGDAYVMTLKLPFARKEALELSSKADELFVKVGPYRRTIMLPKVLTARSVTSAQLVDERLELVFERKEPNGRR